MHPNGANNMASLWLISRNNLVGTGRAIFVLFGLRNKRSPTSGVQGPFFSYSRLAFFERHLLIGGCDLSHISVKDS